MSSTSSTPTPTSSTSSTPHPTETGIQIPTSTVIGIGAGFVCFALSLLALLLLIRFIRLALRAKREGIPVRTAWVDQGGFFGWIHGVGPRDRDRDRRMDELERSGYWGGGGGWYTSEITRMRLWNEIRREREAALARGPGKEGMLGDRPGMWEVDLARGIGGEKEEDLIQFTPLSLGTRLPLPSKDTAPPRKPPAIHLSLLIALPSPTPEFRTGSEEQELPELVIGTTTLDPTIPSEADQHEEEDPDEKEVDPSGMDRKDKKGIEVAHLEYGTGHAGGAGASDPERRAGWIKVKVGNDKVERWVIEGLEDCMRAPIG